LLQVVQGGSIPQLVADLTVFLVLVLLRVILTELSGSGDLNKEVAPMIENHKSGIHSVLETLWAVGVSYLAAGALPT